MFAQQKKILIAVMMTACVGMTGLAVTTRYVVPPETPGANPADDYTSWASAATNIQDAITVAESGDTVLVSNGVYYLTTEVVLTKNIVLRSYSDGEIDMEGTILDAQYPAYSNRCLYVYNESAQIEGFTFTNGFPQADSHEGHGGGLYLSGGAKAQNCGFYGNRASGNGGGIYIIYYSMLADSTVIGNKSGSSWKGGGVFIQTYGVITNCFIANNHALFGGGVGSSTGDTVYQPGFPQIFGCVVSNNVAGPPEGAGGSGGQGGGVQTENYCLIDGCLVTHNTVRASTVGETYGAGIKLGSGGLLQNSVSTYNKNIGACYGGGAEAGNSTVVTNCCFAWNSASYGGGILVSGSKLVVDCTIVSNSHAAFVQGGTMRNCLFVHNANGVWSQAGSPALYQNCTIVNNGGLGLNFSVPGNVENCIVYNNNSGGDNWSSSIATWTNSCTAPMPNGDYDVGNVADAPRFVDAAAGNFNLAGSSPCIDKGIYRDWMAGAFDLQGRKRIIGLAVDMGAFEAPVRLGSLLYIQ